MFENSVILVQRHVIGFQTFGFVCHMATGKGNKSTDYTLLTVDQVSGLPFKQTFVLV